MRAVKRSFNEGEDAAKLDAMTTMAASIVDVEKTKLRSSSSSEDEDGLAEMMTTRMCETRSTKSATR